ncbi:MAG TPA: GNAT family N-acetyltransferase [Acidobacteriota bacterium]|nr:GNAT family N-acetyltransferase [Acidobacteriota bacterium]
MSIEIKILQPDEENLLNSVAPDIFDDPLDVERTREFLKDPRHHLVVAIDQAQVVGFISAVHYVHPDKPNPELWINEVGVAPTHHGQGIGKALMKSLLNLARELNCSEAWVLTERTNLAAMKLYASAGGQEAPIDTVMFNFFLSDTSKE